MTRTSGAPARARVQRSRKAQTTETATQQVVPVPAADQVEQANAMAPAASHSAVTKASGGKTAAASKPALSPVPAPAVRAYSPEELVAFDACPRAAYYAHVCGMAGAGDDSGGKVLKAVKALCTGLACKGQLRPPTDQEVADAVKTVGVSLATEEVARVKKQATVFLKTYSPSSGSAAAAGVWQYGPFVAWPDLVELDHAGVPVRVVLITANGKTHPKDVPGAILTGAVVALGCSSAYVNELAVEVVNTKAAMKDATGLVLLFRTELESVLKEAGPTQKAFADADALAQDGWGEAAFAATPGAACTKCGYAVECTGLPVSAAGAATQEELVAKLGEVLRYERALALVRSGQKPVVAEKGPVEVRGEWWYVSKSTSYSADAQAVAELLQKADRDPFEHLTLSSSAVKELMADEEDALAKAVAAMAKARVTETFRHAGNPPGENGNGGGEGGDE